MKIFRRLQLHLIGIALLGHVSLINSYVSVGASECPVRQLANGMLNQETKTKNAEYRDAESYYLYSDV